MSDQLPRAEGPLTSPPDLDPNRTYTGESEAHAAMAAARAVDAAEPAPPMPAGAAAGMAGGDASRPPALHLEKDKAAIMVVIILAAVVMSVIAVVLMNHQGSTQPRPLEYTPRIDVGMSSQEEIRSFTSKTAREVTEIESTLGTLAKSVDGLMKRQDDTEGLVRQTLKDATATFSSQGSEKIRQMEAYAQASRAEDPRTTRIIDEFRATLANLKESPAEARAHAIMMLRQAGVAEERIRSLLAEAAQESGRLWVGDISEPALSQREVEALPDWVRPLVPSLHDAVYGLALSQGRFYPEQTLSDLRSSLRAHAHQHQLEGVLLERIASVVRVRRENLSPDLEAALPYLVTQRDRRHLSHDDHLGIAHLVWSSRNRYPEGTTAGQMLSMCEVVARSIGANAQSGPSIQPDGSENATTPGFRPLDQITMPFASAVVHAAMVEARNLGKDPQVLGSRALSNYLDTMRMTASPEQVMQLLSPGAAESHDPSAPDGHPEQAVPEPRAPATVPASASPAPNADGLSMHAQVDPEQLLYFGPLRLDRAQVHRALLFAIPGLIAANGLPVQGTSGAASVVGLIEQIPHLIESHLESRLGSPMGGLDFMRTALPQMLQAIHLSTSLGTIQLPVSPQKTNEQSPAAAFMRGVAIGAIYGPLLHDEKKATAAAPDAIRALEGDPPLTTMIAERIGSCLEASPYQGILIALDRIRPGHCSESPERFQSLVQLLFGLDADAKALETRLHGLMSHEDAGNLSENMRMVVPLSAAEHDLANLPLETLSMLVRRDLSDYAVLFISESRLSRQVLEDTIPRYAAAMSEESGGGATLVQDALSVVPSTVAGLFALGPHDQHQEEATLVAKLCEQALPLVEKHLVQEVVLARVEPRLRHQGALDQNALAKAIAHIESSVQNMVVPPYTPARIDAWASSLSSQGGESLSHPLGMESTAPSQKEPPMRRGWPAVTMVPTAIAGALVGSTTSVLHSRHIVIPANSYGNAHLQTGVDAEIGGRANVPVMLELDLDWQGPAGSRLLMRGCRVSGVANALAGPERVAIDLKHLSYVFPSGREFDTEIHGYVADDLSGEFGALGVYHWNADKVMPMAVVAGGFKGAADALKANSTTTIVGAAGTSTVSASQGSQWREAAFGGTAGGFGIMSDYVQSVLSQVHPSVSAVNGQSVSVVILEPVEITVPEREFAEAGMDASGFSP